MLDGFFFSLVKHSSAKPSWCVWLDRLLVDHCVCVFDVSSSWTITRHGRCGKLRNDYCWTTVSGEGRTTNGQQRSHLRRSHIAPNNHHLVECCCSNCGTSCRATKINEHRLGRNDEVCKYETRNTVSPTSFAIHETELYEKRSREHRTRDGRFHQRNMVFFGAGKLYALSSRQCLDDDHTPIAICCILYNTETQFIAANLLKCRWSGHIGEEKERELRRHIAHVPRLSGSVFFMWTEELGKLSDKKLM